MMFDEVSCEEYYNEEQVEAWSAWMDELEREYVNFELQEIAAEQKAGQVAVDLDVLALGI